MGAARGGRVALRPVTCGQPAVERPGVGQPAVAAVDDPPVTAAPVERHHRDQRPGQHTAGRQTQPEVVARQEGTARPGPGGQLGALPPGEHGTHEDHAEHPGDLARRAHQPGRHPGARVGHPGQTAHGQRRGERRTAADQHQPRLELPVTGVQARRRHRQQADGDQHQPHGDRHVRAEEPRRPVGQRGAHQQRPRQRQEREPRAGRGEAEDLLEIEGGEEEHPVDADAPQHLRGHPARQEPVAQQAWFHKRLGAARLHDRERHGPGRRPAQAHQRHGRAETGGAAAHQPVRQEAQGADREERAGHVEARAVAAGGPGRDRAHQEQGQAAQGHIEREHPVPGPVLGDEPADQRAQRERQGERRGPQPDR
ncbi:hypothetical protein OK074_8686, partial [Actinobacteria bacterium OK074]